MPEIMRRSDALAISRSILNGRGTHKGRMRNALHFLNEAMAAVKGGRCSDPRYCTGNALDTWLKVVAEGNE